MEELKYIPHIKNREHIITLKDIFAYYDVKKLTGSGNLRITYGRKDKRDLVISIFNVYIAEMFDVFTKGGIVFNFPDPRQSKMYFEPLKEQNIIKAKLNGKLKMLDPLASNFKSVTTIINIPHNKGSLSTKIGVAFSQNYQKVVYDKLNNRVNMLSKKNTYWDEYMEVIYNSYPTITRASLDKVILFGLRKMLFFMTKGLEVFFNNPNNNEYLYFGRSTNKIKDVAKRNKYLELQYKKKLRWHYQARKLKNEVSYYQISEELYAKHLNKESLDLICFYKIKEECLVGAKWLPYIFKTTKKSSKFVHFEKDYDSSNDELIFIKPRK